MESCVYGPTRRLALTWMVSLSSLPALAVAAPPALATWAGTYRDGARTLTIRADGRFYWQERRVFGGGDVVTVGRGEGSARLEGRSLRLYFDPSLFEPKLPADIDSMPTSYTYDLIEYEGKRLLLNELDALIAINEINRYGRLTLKIYVLVLGAATLKVDSQPRPFVLPEALLPRRFRALVLSSPVVGAVTAVGQVNSRTVMVGGWMQPQRPAKLHWSRITMNVGRAQGVFVGMEMSLGPVSLGPLRQRVQIDRLEDGSSEGMVIWADVGAPAVGQRASSRAVA